MVPLLLLVTVRGGARFKYKHMRVMFILTCRKINTNQYYKLDSLKVGDCSMLWEYMTLQDVEHIIITVHTWTAIFLKHPRNTSFMALFQAWTEPHTGLSLWACFLLPRPTQYLAVYCNGSGFTPSTFCYLGGFSLIYKYLNIITMLHNKCAHMYIHHISITILLFFLHIFHSSWQAGWPRPIPSDTVTAIQNVTKTLLVTPKSNQLFNFVTE